MGVLYQLALLMGEFVELEDDSPEWEGLLARATDRVRDLDAADPGWRARTRTATRRTLEGRSPEALGRRKDRSTERTQAIREVIREGVRAGLGDEAIAARLRAELGAEITPRGVAERRSRLGLARPKAPPIDRAEVRRFAGEGYSAEEIGRMVGAATGTIRTILSELGLTRPRTRG